MKQEPQKTEEKIDIAIANLLFSNLSLEKIEKIPKWLLENIEKNKPQFKQTLHSYTVQREQAVREEYKPLKALVRQMYRQMEDNETVLLFDIVSMAFEEDTGIWPPGKSAPKSMYVEGTTEERSKAFRTWVDNFHNLVSLTPNDTDRV